MTELQDRQARCLKAAGYAKPTKREIVDYIEKLWDDGAQVDPKLVGLVWLYFEPRPSAKASRDVRYWVAQVASPDETREFLRYVRAEPGKLIATDGHRVHVAEVPGVTAAGFLDPTTLVPVVPDTDVVFPPYEQTIPEGVATHTVGLDDFESVSKDMVRLGEVHFDRRYILEAFAGSDTMHVCLGSPLDPARFEGAGRVAVVAPMRP